MFLFYSLFTSVCLCFIVRICHAHTRLPAYMFGYLEVERITSTTDPQSVKRIEVTAELNIQQLVDATEARDAALIYIFSFSGQIQSSQQFHILYDVLDEFLTPRLWLYLRRYVLSKEGYLDMLVIEKYRPGMEVIVFTMPCKRLLHSFYNKTGRIPKVERAKFPEQTGAVWRAPTGCGELAWRHMVSDDDFLGPFASYAFYCQGQSSAGN